MAVRKSGSLGKDWRSPSCRAFWNRTEPSDWRATLIRTGLVATTYSGASSARRRGRGGRERQLVVGLLRLVAEEHPHQPESERDDQERGERDAALEDQGRIELEARRLAAAAVARELAGAAAGLGRGQRLGGRRGGPIAPILGGGDRDVHPPINLAAGLARPRLGVPERAEVGEDPVGRQVQEFRVIVQEAADVDLGQPDVELVALELLQIVAPDLGRLGGLANRDAFAFARVLQAFADGLHA